jgi:DNA-binding NtrC family response regulator
VGLLAHHFVRIHSRSMRKPLTGIDEDAMRLLKDYDYPGNVRELENIIQSAIVFCQDRMIRPENLPEPVRTATGPPAREVRVAAGTPLEEVERLCIIETLKHTEGNKRRAAALLGISEKSVYNKLERYNISVEALETEGEDEFTASAPEQYERA